jgi:hypothetical protein
LNVKTVVNIAFNGTMECSGETYRINTNKLLTETEEKHGNLNRDFRPWNPQMTKRFFIIFGKKNSVLHQKWV